MGRFIVRRTNGEERAANRDCLWLSLFFFFLSTCSELGSLPDLSIFDVENSRETSSSMSLEYVDHSLYRETTRSFLSKNCLSERRVVPEKPTKRSLTRRECFARQNLRKHVARSKIFDPRIERTEFPFNFMAQG